LDSKPFKSRIPNEIPNIHNERIKTKYIPSYIFENEGKLFKKLKNWQVFYEAEIAEDNKFPEN